MHSDSNVPALMLVRVLTAGGPFAPGDAVSVAFATPTVARLVAHQSDAETSSACEPALVPESISVCVTHGAAPYVAGDVLTLSFVDARFARIHPSSGAAVTRAEPPHAPAPATPVVTHSAHAAPVATPERPRDEPVGVRVRFAWNADRARRFVHVVDKLFTVDRLGWYRHVFAMRLLVPDDVDCGDDAGTREAMRHLQRVRAAATETLGRPLLAAFMPGFNVTTEWLETIDSVAIAGALGDLRQTVLPFAVRGAPLQERALGPGESIGILSPANIGEATSSSVDAFLPALVAWRSADAVLSERLHAYRSALSDVFEQTAGSAEAVRTGRMSEPNHVLDDRLWQLVGAVGATCDALAVA